eukprot:4889196-Pleurochrysis_carterae.AAC.1
MTCHGATPRKFEPHRWRSTTDAGAPLKPLTDDSGIVVPSINDLSRKFPHPLEQKPTPRDLANDLALLNHAAHLANDDVFIVTDNVADFFPHLSLAPTEYCFSTLAVLLLPGDAGFSVHTTTGLPLSRNTSWVLVSSAVHQTTSNASA